MKRILLLAGLFVVSFAGMLALRHFVLTAAPPEAAPTAEKPPPAEDPFLAALSEVGAPVMAEAGAPRQQMASLIQELRRRQEELRIRERTVQQREDRLRAAQKQLADRTQELEELQAQLDAPVVRLRKVLATLEGTRVAIAAEEQENLKHQASIFEKMDATAAGRMLARMAEDGQQEHAVKVLYYMGERSAAEVLAAIGDDALASRLCEQMNRIRRPKGS
jgi:flagellar motility protein MotE (MotC chaperone)